MLKDVPKTAEKLSGQDILASGLYSFSFKPVSFHSDDINGNPYVADSVSIQNNKTGERADLHFREDNNQLVWAVRDMGPLTSSLSFVQNLDALPGSERIHYFQRSMDGMHNHGITTDARGHVISDKYSASDKKDVDYFDYVDAKGIMLSLAKIVGGESCPDSFRPYQEKILGYLKANLDDSDNRFSPQPEGLAA